VGRKKVVQVTHDLGIGGLPRVVATLSENLDRDRFETEVLCLNEGGPLADELTSSGIPVRVLPSGRRPDYLAFARVASLFRDLKPEIVHTHNTQPFIDAGLGALLARVPRLIHTDHARDFPDKKRYMLAERVLSHFTHRVVGVSGHTARNLVRFEKMNPDRVVTVFNGIEDSGQGVVVDPRLKRAELGLPVDAPVVGVGVRFTEQKGLRYLLESWPAVLRVIPDARLALAGYGPLEQELKAHAQRLGIAGKSHFLGPRSDMGEVLHAFDVYALPSIWEGFPMILLEAMAACLPVVATHVGGAPEAIEDGCTGLLVEPRDIEGLADALIRLLSDPGMQERFGRSGRQRFEENFTASVMARAYERLYEDEAGFASHEASVS
jgi:glycosyltransferase involved in cell wall biosynthesis